MVGSMSGGWGSRGTPLASLNGREAMRSNERSLFAESSQLAPAGGRTGTERRGVGQRTGLGQYRHVWSRGRVRFTAGGVFALVRCTHSQAQGQYQSHI